MKKIEGKFYPLKLEEWLKACRKLKPAELKVLYYIRTADPYSNGIRLNAAAIARDLSTEADKVSRQTVSRAIKNLDKLGYIDMEPIEFNVRILGKGTLVCEDTEVCGDTMLDQETPLVCTDTIVDRHTPQAIATHHPQTESITTEGFQTPKTIKTNEDLIKTLSEEPLEREKKFVLFKESLSEEEFNSFWDYAMNTALSFKESMTTTAIRLPESWIKKNHQELYNQFLDQLEKQYGSRNFQEILIRESFSANL